MRPRGRSHNLDCDDREHVALSLHTPASVKTSIKRSGTLFENWTEQERSHK